MTGRRFNQLSYDRIGFRTFNLRTLAVFLLYGKRFEQIAKRHERPYDVQYKEGPACDEIGVGNQQKTARNIPRVIHH